MASDNEACCESDPNFAVICGFLEKFGVTCGLSSIDILDLQDMLENSQEVPQELIDLHIKLLRKARKTVSTERWERAIIKLCHGFCSQDAWEIERFGYKKARLSSKLRILKELLEMQFDYNVKFKNEINKLSAEELRTQPLGRDRGGHVYWFQSDNSCQIRVYKEDPDEETWTLVAKDREGLVNLITKLNDGKETVVNEDSNSLESEKPVIDTGQTDSSSNSQSAKSDQANTIVENSPEPAKPEESSEKPQAGTEDATQTVEIIKPGKIRIKNKEVLISEVGEAIDCSNGNSTMEETKLAASTDEETKEKSQIVVSPPKSGISIRIKPISELISPPLDVTKKEVTGVKEKYIRTESSSSSSTHHRKAVDSAGFDVHTNYLKRPIEEEEDVEEPSYMKRPRLDRPTLLGNKKKKPYSDEEEEEEEVSDEIEEPLMLVTGDGLGQDNEGGKLKNFPRDSEDSPVIGEEIEESIFYFYGEGNGNDCETGNESTQKEQTSQESTSSSNPESVTPPQEKNDVVDSIDNKSLELPKPGYKLGKIIDVRSSEMVTCKRDPKKSRWDLRKPETGRTESQENSDMCNINSDSNQENKDQEEKCISVPESDESEEKPTAYAEQVTPNKMFFFGPGCLQVKPTISPLKATSTFGESVTKVADEDREEKQIMLNAEKENYEPHNVSAEDAASKSNSSILNMNHVSENNENEDFREKCDTETSLPLPKQPDLAVLNQKEDELSPNSIAANQHVPNSSVSAKTDSFSSDIQDVKLNNVPVFDKSSLLDTRAVTEDRLCSKNEVLPNEDQSVHIPEKPKTTIEEVLESARKTDNVGIIPPLNSSGTSKERVEDASKKEESSISDILREKLVVNQEISISGDKSLLTDQGAESPIKPSKEQEVAEKVDEKLILPISKNDINETTTDSENPASISIDKVASSEKLSIDEKHNTSNLNLGTIKDGLTNEENTQASKTADNIIASEKLKLNESISTVNEEIIENNKSQVEDEAVRKSQDVAEKENPVKVDKEINENSLKNDNKHNDNISEAEIELKTSRESESNIFKNLPESIPSSENLTVVKQIMIDSLKPHLDEGNKSNIDSIITNKNLPEEIKVCKNDTPNSSKTHLHKDNEPQMENIISTNENLSEEIKVCKSITDDGKFDENENKNIKEVPEIEKSLKDETSEPSKKEQEYEKEYLENKSPESIASSPLDATSFQHSDIDDEDIEESTDVTTTPKNSENLESKTVEPSVDTNKDDKDDVNKQSEEGFNKHDTEQSISENANLLEHPSKNTVSEEMKNTNATIVEDKVTSEPEKLTAGVEVEKIIDKHIEESATAKSSKKYEAAEASAKNINTNTAVIEEKELDQASMENKVTNKDFVEEKMANKAITEDKVSKTTADDKATNKATAEVKVATKTNTEVIPANKPTTEIKAATKTNTEVIPANKPTTEIKAANKTTADDIVENKAATEIKPVNKTTTEDKAANKTTAEDKTTNKSIPEVKAASKTITEGKPANKPTTEVKAANKTPMVDKETNKHEESVKIVEVENPLKLNPEKTLGSSKTTKNSEEQPAPPAKITVSRRSTRRTRSSTNETPEEPPEVTEVKVDGNKNDEVEKPKRGRRKRGTVKPEDTANISEQKEPPVESGRELRHRKVSDIVKPEKQVKKGRGRPKMNNKTEEKVENDGRQQQQQQNIPDLIDIEDQIVKNEIIRPSKKLRLDSEEQKESEKKEHPRRRSLRSNQDKSEEKVVVNKDTPDKPVNEPKCVQKKVPLLTCVDISTLKDKPKDETETNSDPATSVAEANTYADSDDDVTVIPDSDPLAVSDDENETPKPKMTLATFKIDLEDSIPIAGRITRKRAAQQSVDALRDSQASEKKVEINEDGNSKKPKLKKRSVDRNLRKSVEEQKSKVASSSEEEEREKIEKPVKKGRRKGKTIAQRRVSTRSATADSPAISSDAPSEVSRTDNSNTPPVVKQRKPRSRKKKTLMGLEISEVNESLLKNDTESGVRQSRRIAQLKIREEAERRKLEEVTLQDIQEEPKKRKGKKAEDKDFKLEKKKRSKHVVTEDETTCDAESDEKKKRKRKRKHWDPTKKIDLHHAWKASSGSSSSEVEDEEEEIEEDDDSQLVMKSDHEFSPESDLEDGGEVRPLKRARTARKESDAEEEVDDCACQKCGQKDHPEWILLCDSCDSGWHCSCLRPALLVIPEGDWFCPPCQHITLVKNLEGRLQEYDKKLNKLEMETRRKERLAYVGISLDNVLPSKESDEHRRKKRLEKREDEGESGDEDRDSDDSDSDESGSDSDSSSSSGSDSDEPIYQLRERRQTHSYRFNDYDELINSAIQDEMEAVKGAGNQGRGKDIATIVNAEKEEEAQRLRDEASNTDAPVDVPPVDGAPPPPPPENGADPIEKPPELEPLPPVVPVDYEDAKPENESDNEVIRPVRRIITKKKHRKLNCLDVSSGDDPESDEDFKGSSSSGSEEEFDDLSGSESSDASTRRGKRRKDYAPIRRSTRARTSRYDRDFINDSNSEDDQAPRRKRNRSLWDESEESEESDRSWGRRKRRGGGKPKRKSVGKVKKSKKKKKKKRGDDSDPEVYRKKPNIKFGGLNNEEEDIGRRTRGKKINYLEALGTDSEEEIRRKPPRIEESEEEYNLHDDEDFQQMENNKDSDDSGPDPVLQEIAKSQPKSKPKGRGKAGLKIPRKPKDQPPPDFASLADLSKPLLEPLPPGAVVSVLPPLPDIPGIPPQLPPLPSLVAAAAAVLAPVRTDLPPMLLQNSELQEELQDPDDEPNPIEQINKNVEEMNEQEMEKMMEEEDYANKQLQLVALQIEKEKKRKEREAKRLQTIVEQDKTPKKRGCKPKSAEVTQVFPEGSLLNSSMTNNAELSEPPGVSLPMFSEIAPVLSDGTPKKRGRAKGKKDGGPGTPGKNTPESEMGVDSPGSAVSPSPNSPLHGSKLVVAAPPQPFSQSQPTPSVITRMLQSQPGQENFASGGKFFGDIPNDPAISQASGPFHAGGPRGPLPSSYQQPPPGMPPHYPVVRSGPVPPHRLHSPGGLPPMYHHRSMDPSPSGGGSINVSTANRDRQSPVVPPAASSPLSKGDPTPPPPPYTRPQVPFSSASVSTSGPRHISLVPPHFQQHRPTNMSPYHPGMPPNYYGSYPPPPLNDEGQSPPVYPSPAYAEYPEGGAPISGGENAKFDDETSGEFVGLVSYFSSQREDDLDT